MVVQVDSTGLSVPDELDSFCLAAWDADIEGGEFARTYQFDDDIVDLPQSLTIEAGHADAAELIVRGYRDGIEVARVRRVVEFSGVRDESLVLDRCAPGSAAAPTLVGAATVPAGTRVAASFGRRGTLVASVGPMSSAVFRAYSEGIDTASVTAPPVSAGDPPLDVLAFDVDGDCDDDLVILPASAPPVLWRRGSEGSFSAVEGAFGATVGIHRAIAAADVDDDGDIDLAAGGAASLIILLNDGGGRFEVDPAPIPGDATTDVMALAFGDVDDDRDPDLVVGRGELVAQPLRVLRNTSGSFGPIAGALPETPVLARQVELFDADDDRRVDLLVASQTSALVLYGNAGAGVFADRSVATLPTQEVIDANAISAGDWDGDCLTDVVIGRPAAAPALLWRGSDGGMLEDEGFVRPASGGAWLADVDDDGARDLVIVDAGEGLTWTRR